MPQINVWFVFGRIRDKGVFVFIVGAGGDEEYYDEITVMRLMKSKICKKYDVYFRLKVINRELDTQYID